MKSALVAALSLALAAPVLSVPTVSDAQVLTGRGSAPRGGPSRPALSEAELERLFDAEDRVVDLDGQIADIQAEAENAGGLTDAQQRQIAELTRQRDEAQRTVDRLERKRNR